MQTTSAQIYAHSVQWCNSSSFSVIKVVQQERTWGYFHNETIKTYPSHLSIAYPNVFPFCSASYSECYINLKTCSSMIISVTIFLNLIRADIKGLKFHCIYYYIDSQKILPLQICHFIGVMFNN